MSSSRGSRSLVAVAAGAVFALAGGCASGGDDTADESAPSPPALSPRPSATGQQPLTAAELAAALPRQGALPGYRVNSAPEARTGAEKSDHSVRPAACQPLEDARSGVFADSAAGARVPISPLKFAPPTETLTFTSYRPRGAAAHLASLTTALDACPSFSMPTRYGERVSVDVARAEDQVSAGDASVSFRLHWATTANGFTSDTYVLVTTVRSGEATLTDVADTGVGSQLSDAKKRAFLPKPDERLLKSQADALDRAQHA
ncbi:hypothetical protein [Streptomyces sp. SID8499]|uniref:hypothetical protein n=1 Tax=Streptomyces sp. SID8499 TaxID=2706106 RepID=UPI0013CB5955|nr:hypothetical protein [Streptomyces sp. SID8499]NED35946.1 hypothetical protein [Streptomyces sp. SID8499]